MKSQGAQQGEQTLRLNVTVEKGAQSAVCSQSAPVEAQRDRASFVRDNLDVRWSNASSEIFFGILV